MAVPKRKTSRSRLRARKRAHRVVLPASKPCPNCGQPQLPHRVCPACGYYKGRQVVSLKAE